VRHLSKRRIAPSRPLLAALAALLFALAAAAPASASSTTKILEACSEGKIPKGYSQQAYNRALRHMPSELAEYSDCPSLIHKAELAGVSGGGGAGGLGGGGGTSGAGAVTPPTPAEQHALESIAHSGGSPVSVGGEAIHPGVVHVDIASALGSLPTPLLTLLVFLVLCAVAIVGWSARNYVRARRLHDTGAAPLDTTQPSV
jgi:hypothetical protein